jgi:hypothetical protein
LAILSSTLLNSPGQAVFNRGLSIGFLPRFAFSPLSGYFSRSDESGGMQVSGPVFGFFAALGMMRGGRGVPLPLPRHSSPTL